MLYLNRKWTPVIRCAEFLGGCTAASIGVWCYETQFGQHGPFALGYLVEGASLYLGARVLLLALGELRRRLFTRRLSP